LAIPDLKEIHLEFYSGDPVLAAMHNKFGGELGPVEINGAPALKLVPDADVDSILREMEKYNPKHTTLRDDTLVVIHNGLVATRSGRSLGWPFKQINFAEVMRSKEQMREHTRYPVYGCAGAPAEFPCSDAD